MVDQQLLRVCPKRPRVFIVSDISNEPDDAESLVRYLLYSNEFDTRGLVACTSTWMPRNVHPEDMERIINAYSQVEANLNHHSHPENPYPTAQFLLSLIKTGPALYGKQALEPGVPLSDGARLLIERLDESEEPLWVLCWGGTNVLAQALQYAQKQRSTEDLKILRSKMRVYAISDQDDTGDWIRVTFPDIFYINSIHGWNQYGLAAWTGISGDQYYGFDQGGPDFTKVSKPWLKENIQVGPLGKTYPDYMFIPEGDTPTFLYLIQNGLGSPEHPEWGSWGGRYCRSVSDRRHYCDAVDRVIGKDGKKYISNHATIWRWRDAFQNDFAARMKWTLTSDISSCNHSPVIVIQGSRGPEPIALEVEAGEEVTLDASESYDPDGDELTFRWFQYSDVTATQWWVEAEVSNLEIRELDVVQPGRAVKVKLPPPEKCAVEAFTGKAKEIGQTFHLILEVKDNGSPSLVSYKRILLTATNKELKGGRDHAVETIAQAHEKDFI